MIYILLLLFSTGIAVAFVSRRHFTARRLLVAAIAVGALIFVAITMILFETRKSTIYNLPEDATNIVRYSSSPNVLCEFDTSEKSFRKWVADQNSPVMGPVLREGSAILRYDPVSKNADIYVVRDALVSEWTGSQPDNGQHMVYDFAIKRAYFWSHSR